MQIEFATKNKNMFFHMIFLPKSEKNYKLADEN